MNEPRKRVSLHAPIRWGGSEVKNITVDPALGVLIVPVPSFVDLKLPLGPQALSIALYATTKTPGGISVQWTLGLGTGSTNQMEVFSVAATDELAQVPVILERPAMSVQIGAQITATFVGAKGVKLAALIAPISPTWVTDIGCVVSVREEG